LKAGEMRDVVIFGMGQIAEVIHYYLTEEGGRNVVAFTVDAEFRKADEMFGLPVVDFEEVERRFPPETHEMFVAVSFRQVNKAREEKVAAAEAKGYKLTSHVSPRATVWSKLVVNPNTIIMENNVIQPFVTIGRNVIMWSGNHVGHHSEIGDNCFIASHAVISGSCRIGAGSFIGVNATLRDNIEIGARNVIGAGTLILQSSPDNAVFIGPATPQSPVPSNRLRSI
jgi:sugar O-acyltransferase (sialic acid O-acetyltransferase NeuD family)